MSCCPTCGHKLATKPTIEAIAEVPLPHVLRTVANVLIKAYPEPVPADDLVLAIYRGSMLPGNPRAALRVQLTRLRDKIALCGWTVSKGIPGPGGRADYGLELRPNNHV